MDLKYKELWATATKTVRELGARLGMQELELGVKTAEANKLKAENTQLKQQIHQFSYDEITGLPGRRLMEKLFDQQLALAQRANFQKECQQINKDMPCPLSVLLIDLDKFKSINDNYGHDGGDQVLRWFAMVVKESIRHSDIAGRYGGDEFVVILPKCDMDNAVAKVKKIADDFVNIQRESGQEIISTLSAGIACLASNSDTAEDLIKRADAAMYEAKKNNGNSCVEAKDNSFLKIF